MRFFWTWFFIGLISWSSPVIASEKAHVAVGQIVEHPALNSLRECLKRGLEAQGYQVGKNLEWTYENAQGNPTTAVQVAQKLKSLEPDVIVTLSTPMAQATAATTTEIPIVFGAVTDPKAAKLTGPNITGLTDVVPPLQQIELLQALVPHVKTIGVLFNSGEANAQKQAQEIKKAAELNHIKVVEATVSKSSEVSSATKTLVGKVEAILLPTDNTVITALESILKIGNSHKIPIFGSDVDIVRRGALAAYGVDWCESGLTLAEIVTSILEGTPPHDLPPQDPKHLVLHINVTAAQHMGITVPETLQKQADHLF